MSDPQQLLSDSALTAFRLNGQFLAVAEALAAPAGLTATRWQVLGAVLSEPLSVSDIAREMGITRQSVQRTADLLAEQGLVTFRDNPAHRRAKLVDITEAGLSAVRLINPGHREIDIGTEVAKFGKFIVSGRYLCTVKLAGSLASAEAVAI